MNNVVIAAAMSLALAGSANAAEAFKSFIPEHSNGRVVAFYRAACSIEEAHECVVFDVGCDETGKLLVTIPGSEKAPKASLLTVDTKAVKLTLATSESDDLNGGFYLQYSLPATPALITAKRLAVPGTSVSLTKRMQGQVAAAMKACGVHA